MIDTYQVLKWPDQRLTLKAAPVLPEEQDAIVVISKKMIATMVQERGIGLAATQVGILKRILVMVHLDQVITLVNPSIIIASEDRQTLKEGCLSFPNVWEQIERPKKVVVSALDENFKAQTYQFQGLEATCFQHELDHLNGIVFIKYLSPMKQLFITKKINKKAKR